MIDTNELKEIVKRATDKNFDENIVKFSDKLIEDIKGKDESEIICICISRLFAESYKAVENTLFDVLSQIL